MAIILITGAKGQLGNELKVVSQKYYGYDFIFTDVDTLDITNPVKTAEYIKKPTGFEKGVVCKAPEHRGRGVP